MDYLGEYILFGLYAIAGPLMGVLFGIALVKGRKRMMLLGREASVEPSGSARVMARARVTVLIPARNEGKCIGESIRSVLGQDWANLEVVAVDDRSSDETGRVMDELALGDRRLKVVHIAEEPAAG